MLTPLISARRMEEIQRQKAEFETVSNCPCKAPCVLVARGARNPDELLLLSI